MNFIKTTDNYPWMSPYSYCGLNPANNIDPDGQDWVSAQYEDDYFFFWFDKIKSQDDINKMIRPNEGIKYLGKEKNLTIKIGDKDISVSLNEDGHFSIDSSVQREEYNNNNIHIGSEHFTQLDYYDNSNTLKSNWYGMYLGPNNPKLKDGGDSYAVPPVCQLDFAAYQHDIAYDNAGAKGISGALFNTKATQADANLVNAAVQYQKDWRHNITGLEWANRVQRGFGIITYNKYLYMLAKFYIQNPMKF